MTALKQLNGSAARRFSRARRLCVALGATAMLLLTACGGPSDSGTAGLQDVTFLTNVPTADLTFAPELVAQTCGEFEKEGLNVKFQYINGAPAGIQAVLAGSALLVRPGDTDTMQSIATGAPIVNVGAVQKAGSTLRIVSHRNRPLTTAASLAGKTMGVGSTGGSTKVTLDLVLATAGLKPEALNRQVVGLTPAVFNLVQAGKLDGYVVSLATALTLQAQQPDAVVFNPASVITAGSNNYITSVDQARDPAKADQIRRYERAIQASMRFIMADKATGYAETKKCIASQYDVPGLDDETVLRQSLDTYAAAWTANGPDALLQTDPTAWQRTYDDMARAGLIAGGQDPSRWYTNEFATASP
ncbi:ABC transporter substrate-binding protein [Saccharopolyspora sp. K220]|uniref:ABC transporter substrate-binding protein n=1 Tax=Saccharopolyspora soli TaxID=2926618 RepID=UPI001F5A9DB7|nr:ABC transporter substrate-binding protein [Saccharopolyspora soli]MCI2423202.1 ABC transporter substrate-binding protein [Saccharopolyspora soli]